METSSSTSSTSTDERSAPPPRRLSPVAGRRDGRRLLPNPGDAMAMCLPDASYRADRDSACFSLHSPVRSTAGGLEAYPPCPSRSRRRYRAQLSALGAFGAGPLGPGSLLGGIPASRSFALGHAAASFLQHGGEVFRERVVEAEPGARDGMHERQRGGVQEGTTGE